MIAKSKQFFYSCTYAIRWNPGGGTSPLVLFINAISQTALLAVLLDWIFKQRKCFLRALSSERKDTVLVLSSCFAPVVAPVHNCIYLVVYWVNIINNSFNSSPIDECGERWLKAWWSRKRVWKVTITTLWAATTRHHHTVILRGKKHKILFLPLFTEREGRDGSERKALPTQ